MDIFSDDKKKPFMPIIIVILAASLLVIVYTNIFSSKGNHQEYHQTALATFFAPTKYSPIVELTSAQANSKKLTILLTVSGLGLIKSSDDFENIVCDPYIKTSEDIQLALTYRYAPIPSRVEEPLVITYEYSMDSKKYQSLHIEMDFTIGPCGPYFQESNITPYPPIDMIGNYKLSFVVPIK
jgi:hypothetical protein